MQPVCHWESSEKNFLGSIKNEIIIRARPSLARAIFSGYDSKWAGKPIYYIAWQNPAF